MSLLTAIPFDLDPEHLMKMVHIEPDSEDETEFRAFCELARTVGNPKAVYRECFIENKDKDTVTIDGITFTSRTLSSNLSEVERVFAYVATCGIEMDEHNPAGDDFLKEFWWDTIKAHLLFAAQNQLTDHLTKRFALSKTAAMHPGSGDTTIWTIDQQAPLFELIGTVQDRIGVELTDTFLMVPNKTVSGIRFATQKDFRSCQVCHREKCDSRSAPFDPELWEKLQHD